MAGTFLKHESGDVVLVQTAAEMQHYQAKGYAVCTWNDWYSAQLARDEKIQAADALRKDGEE